MRAPYVAVPTDARAMAISAFSVARRVDSLVGSAWATHSSVDQAIACAQDLRMLAMSLEAELNRLAQGVRP